MLAEAIRLRWLRDGYSGRPSKPLPPRLSLSSACYPEDIAMWLKGARYRRNRKTEGFPLPSMQSAIMDQTLEAETVISSTLFG